MKKNFQQTNKQIIFKQFNQVHYPSKKCLRKEVLLEISQNLTRMFDDIVSYEMYILYTTQKGCINIIEFRKNNSTYLRFYKKTRATSTKYRGQLVSCDLFCGNKRGIFVR